MKLLFTKSNGIGSRLIRWTLREDCSHLAICFDEWASGSGIVFESTSRGTSLSWFIEWRKHQTVIHALEFSPNLTLQEEEELYLDLLKTYSGIKYDWGTLTFWAWRGFLWRFFGVKLPKKDQWAVDGYNLSTGLAKGVGWIKKWAEENHIDLELIGPQELYERLKASGRFSEEPFWCSLTNHLPVRPR